MSEAAGEVLNTCPSEEIGAYLDAELPADRASALEAHFASCQICRDELNSQKAFLLALSRSLERDEAIELPEDFTRTIVTKAESSVSGLRKRSERIAAFAIAALLLIVALLGFAGDWGRVSAEAARPLGAAAALFEVASSLFYNVVFAVGFVSRKAFSGAPEILGFAAAVAVISVSIILIFMRIRRSARNAG